MYAIFSHNSFNLPNEFDYYSIEGLITIEDDEKNPFHHSFYEYHTQKLQLAKKLTKYYHFLNVTSEYFCWYLATYSSYRHKLYRFGTLKVWAKKCYTVFENQTTNKKVINANVSLANFASPFICKVQYSVIIISVWFRFC